MKTLFGIPYGVGQLIMIPIGLVLMYLAIVKGFEPLLLLSLSFGGLLANCPLSGIVAPPCLVALFSTNRPGVRGRRSSSNETSRPFSFVLTSDNVAQMMLERLISTFRDEGFFTSLLNADENIWSVMLNDAEISVRREGRRRITMRHISS